jgi:hypothetical protein
VGRPQVGPDARRSLQRDCCAVVSQTATACASGCRHRCCAGPTHYNSGITALVSLLHEKTLELYGTAPLRLPNKILVLLINSFPAPPEQYVKPHRGTFFQMWAPLLTLLTVRGAAHDAMAQRELSLFRETLKNLNGIELSWIDFRFREAVRRSGDDEAAQEPPPLSWHLTKRQKLAIVNAIAFSV